MAGAGGPGQHLERRRVRMGDRIGFRDPSEAFDRRPVEADALFKGAPSSSAGAIATDLRKPSTSVNHSRTNRMSRSSSVRSTNSFCRSIPGRVCTVPLNSVLPALLNTVSFAGAARPSRPSNELTARVHARIVSAEGHGVLGALEGDRGRRPSLAGQIDAGLVRSGRVVSGGHDDDLARGHR